MDTRENIKSNIIGRMKTPTALKQMHKYYLLPVEFNSYGRKKTNHKTMYLRMRDENTIFD